MPRVSHSGLPIPADTYAKISWKYCAHAGCNEQFYNEDHLIAHLESNNCYSFGFSKSHDHIIKINNVRTIEDLKTILNGSTQCPSMLCDFSGATFEDVVKHFREIGIRPFY